MIVDGVELEATYLRDGRWAVRPKGKLGTHGFINGRGWTVVYTSSSTADAAIRRAVQLGAPWDFDPRC